MNENTINIRQIQHYMYCPRRFALLEVNDDWAENALVIKANLIHENVHNGSHGFSSAMSVSKSSVTIYNDDPQYDIFGIADCVEFVKSGEGPTGEISYTGNKSTVKIVEYKPTQPKGGGFNETDAIQVFAQKICVDFIFNCESEGYIYYANTKKRAKLPFAEQFESYNKQLLNYLGEMREIIQTGVIPEKRKGQSCGGCSLADYCFSKSVGYSVRKEILKLEEIEKKEEE